MNYQKSESDVEALFAAFRLANQESLMSEILKPVPTPPIDSALQDI